MNARIASPGGIRSGRCAIFGYLGDGLVIGAAIIALLAATLVAFQVLPHDGSVFRGGQTTSPWTAGLGLSAQLQQGGATDLGQRVCYDGSAVLLTCYTQQPDGQWQRAEMQEDTTWVVVGTVTSNEMQTAVAAANARVP